MYKYRLKINFFQSQIEKLAQLQENLYYFGLDVKQALLAQNVQQQKHFLTHLPTKLQIYIDQLQKQIVRIKISNNLPYDDAYIQGHIVLKSLADKLQDLNQKIFEAQKNVQIAQQIQKQRNLINAQYQMSNVKQFKRLKQQRIIKEYLYAEQKVIQQFKRCLQLMIKISYKKIEQNYNDSVTELKNILEYRKNSIKFKQFKLHYNKISQNLRKSKSEQKLYFNKLSTQIPQNKFKKQALILILLKSAWIRYKKQRQYALTTQILQLREKNKKSAVLNKLLNHGVELKNHEQVYKHIQAKLNQKLALNQSILKMKLMSAKLNQKFEQRLLGIKSKMKCLDFIQGNLCNKIRIIKRKVKSSQKQTKFNQDYKDNKSSRIKILSKRNYQKHFPSISKTNDSLTAGFLSIS